MLLDCVCYNKDFVTLEFIISGIMSGFCSTCLIVILARLGSNFCHFALTVNGLTQESYHESVRCDRPGNCSPVEDCL